jgi:hypothetical protein
MATLTDSGTLAFPLADEATPPSRTYSFELVYTQKSVKDLVLTGAASDEDLMDGIADAKAIFIECLTGEGTIEVNTATAGVAIAASGGWFSWYNAAGGLTACTVTTSDDASFRVYLFA